jgi:hypothetical protein
MGPEGINFSPPSDVLLDMTLATLIAKQLDETAEAILQETISLEEGSETIQGLWDLSRKLGLEAEVDRLSQKSSKKEFAEACEASGTIL